MVVACPAGGGGRLLRVLNLGWSQLVPYAAGLQLQEALYGARRAGGAPDTLVLLQHSPVYTIGKRGRDSDFRVPVEELRARGIEIHHAPRGGEVTFHGPRQLVAYPVVDVRDAKLGARAFVEALEDSIVDTVAAFGISARGRVAGATGVWVGERKIAAIGVKLSHGVSSHGLALNVDTDLSAFGDIIPCGIADKDVTSIAAELAAGRAASPSANGLATSLLGLEREAAGGMGLRGAPVLGGHVHAREHVLCVGDAARMYEDAAAAFVRSFASRLRYGRVEAVDVGGAGALDVHVAQLLRSSQPSSDAAS
ncbi:hypothetical protein FOA52_002792 [Chlamydomonas sp. UWO 241]|nr:hypothetical protein FOA52_002792 [Chlamydomonas sp. UWO 241]